MRYYLMVLLSSMYSYLYAAAPDTIHIHFGLDKDELRNAEKALLDGMVYEDSINDRKEILIVGYTDYLGSTEYNIGLSERRAKAIYRHLVSLNIPPENIKMVIGKGEIARNEPQNGGYATDRRVDVIISDKKKAITTTIKTPESKSTTTVGKKLTDINVGQSIRLKNINFLMGRHVLTQSSIPTLEELFKTLQDNPTLKIQIEGHVCCVPLSAYDAEDEDTMEPRLSENRAKYIYDYLVSKGIDRSRMQYKGFGRTKPLIYPETTPQDEDQNRRVEIRVIEK
ncbi:MAG TPA: OmpA family protein [Flavipsychrobacter sp.]|nr:OmpA family protein [Flavipsychrobacter sp.]